MSVRLLRRKHTCSPIEHVLQARDSIDCTKGCNVQADPRCEPAEQPAAICRLQYAHHQAVAIEDEQGLRN
jgi:hypothetical protein